MSFSSENGYIPLTFNQLMNLVREQVNERFLTNYTEDNFVGTGWYKFAYTILQRVQESEVKTAEIFLKLQEYIRTTNEKIQRPSVSFPGLLDSFASKGYLASVKPPALIDAGKIFICVDVDDEAPDYPQKKLEICTNIKDFVAAGLVSVGTQVESIILPNGQSFDFSFNLPNRIPVKLKANFIKSKNYFFLIPSDEDIRELILVNVLARYRLGWDFEPERYISVSDAQWASDVTLEWSTDDGETWNDTIYTAAYDDLFEIELDDIQVVIT